MPVDADDYRLGLTAIGKDLDRLVRRLQTLSTQAWRSRREPVIAVLVDLIELCGRLEGRPMPRLPDLGDYALADATAVIAGDVLAVLAARVDELALSDMQAQIERALILTR